ncbi:hypothetical protein BSKO_05893 [Bryopsis sp. KO-2023]|nr:hypothetical protein BSKO_05893 [Bryopsis sp. KO-2023]
MLSLGIIPVWEAFLIAKVFAGFLSVVIYFVVQGNVKRYKARKIKDGEGHILPVSSGLDVLRELLHRRGSPRFRPILRNALPILGLGLLVFGANFLDVGVRDTIVDVEVGSERVYSTTGISDRGWQKLQHGLARNESWAMSELNTARAIMNWETLMVGTRWNQSIFGFRLVGDGAGRDISQVQLEPGRKLLVSSCIAVVTSGSEVLVTDCVGRPAESTSITIEAKQQYDPQGATGLDESKPDLGIEFGLERNMFRLKVQRVFLPHPISRTFEQFHCSKYGLSQIHACVRFERDDAGEKRLVVVDSTLPGGGLALVIQDPNLECHDQCDISMAALASGLASLFPMPGTAVDPTSILLIAVVLAKHKSYSAGLQDNPVFEDAVEYGFPYVVVALYFSILATTVLFALLALAMRLRDRKPGIFVPITAYGWFSVLVREVKSPLMDCSKMDSDTKLYGFGLSKTANPDVLHLGVTDQGIALANERVCAGNPGMINTNDVEISMVPEQRRPVKRAHGQQV